jgi:hypothetical protein
VSGEGGAVRGRIAPKAVREGYAPPPFVFEERHESGEIRFVAWTPDVLQLKRTLYAVLERLPEQVEVLFKTETGGESARDGWQRYFATADLAAVVEAIREAEELIFHDGGSMICVKDAGTGDYIALDEHATLFIYSSDRTYLMLFEGLGFENRMNALISAAGHWQVRPARHQEQERSFIERLNLEPIP